MRYIHTPDAPPALGPYSQGVISRGMLYTAGQIALTPDGELVQGITMPGEERIEGNDLVHQTHQVMRNLGAVLNAVGIGYEDVISSRIYLANRIYEDYPRAFQEINEVYGGYFLHNKPVRECVAATPPRPGAFVEISMIAEMPNLWKRIFRTMVTPRD